MARHSREKDFGHDLSMSEEDLKALLSGAVKEPIIVNGVETSDFYYRLPDRPRRDFSPEAAISASMRAFLDSDRFEDAVRRSTALGGDSCTISAIAGSVGIDSVSGLLKINAGGDFDPMEWFQERTESVFNSVSIDSIMEAMGRYYLDEGIGIFDLNRTSNLQTANNDVAHSKDSRLQELVNSKSTRIPTGVKR